MRLPSLNALRAFEAAARHESFVRAANELCVTEGAVSRHIKLLEEELGVTLFRRLTRKVELTDEGHQLLPVVGGAFADISSGAARVAARKLDVKIVSAHTFSIRWLVPRLARHRPERAGIGVQVTTKIYAWEDLLTDEYDMGFACTLDGMPRGLKGVPFLPLRLTPACSPQLLEKTPLDRVPDLAGIALLHTGLDYGDWSLWAERFAEGKLDVERGMRFSDRDAATRSAVMGMGVVICDLTLMQEEIASGQLVTPFPDMVFSSVAADYHAICRDEMWDDPNIIAFYQWLIDERDGDYSRKEN